MFTVLIQTLGCKLNQLESEAVADAFSKSGFALYKPSSGAPPSIIVINTCTVTSKADQKARRVIRKALRDYPDSCVLVTGCYAQLNYAQLSELDTSSHRRLFVLKGMEKDRLLNLPEFINEKAPFPVPYPPFPNSHICEAVKAWYEDGTESGGTDVFQFSPERFSSHTRGFLKIQDGCDKHCTYCRIRLARGHSISLNAQTALERLRILEKNHAEAVLTGVNICQYRDGKNTANHASNLASNLARLLEYLLSGTEKIALRLSSLAPESIDEDLAKVLSHKRIRPHFHLSIQSGSEKVLEKMGRNYNAKTVEKAVTLLRCAKDDPFLACDIITGFPCETNLEFEETAKLCQETDFAWIHVFPYSKRPGTPAWSFPGTVQEKEVTKRVQLLTDMARQGRADYVRRWVGREVEVLVEKGSTAKSFCAAKSFCRGVSENYLKLLVQYNGEKAPPPGSVSRCKLLESPSTEKTVDYDAIAEMLIIS
ncbi:MAG: tRNA (N(6)-L-threonylcarbamoyladenosine(37)-C(2))-methylthiotransferase MtaB [Treponema sp.]|nr:tRNA (N(6)-L-threonylcarbamoyladenosine(37)-C(2))-methylthiotransferase MtaB [Treponema sp.]